jgi:hypothetical protein
MNNELKSFMHLLLPEFLIEHFIIVKVDTISERVDIYLEEKSIAPAEYAKEDLICHGFHKQSVIRDFPIRGKQVYLYVKRRRWLNKNTNEILSRNWEVTAKGTRMTEDFAAFLKGID